MQFIELKALAGVNYARAHDVIAVQYVEPQKCNVMMAGGASLSCNEAAKDVVARIKNALSPTSETDHGHASR